MHLNRQALAWLKLAQDCGALLPLSLSTVKRRTRELRAALGLARWPQDVLRHTAASVALALTGDAARVCAELGTSERMLFRHYRAVLRREEAAMVGKFMPKDRWNRRVARGAGSP